MAISDKSVNPEADSEVTTSDAAPAAEEPVAKVSADNEETAMDTSDNSQKRPREDDVVSEPEPKRVPEKRKFLWSKLHQRSCHRYIPISAVNDPSEDEYQDAVENLDDVSKSPTQVGPPVLPGSSKGKAPFSAAPPKGRQPSGMYNVDIENMVMGYYKLSTDKLSDNGEIEPNTSVPIGPRKSPRKGKPSERCGKQLHRTIHFYKDKINEGTPPSFTDDSPADGENWSPGDDETEDDDDEDDAPSKRKKKKSVAFSPKLQDEVMKGELLWNFHQETPSVDSNSPPKLFSLAMGILYPHFISAMQSQADEPLSQLSSTSPQLTPPPTLDSAVEKVSSNVPDTTDKVVGAYEDEEDWDDDKVAIEDHNLKLISIQERWMIAWPKIKLIVNFWLTLSTVMDLKVQNSMRNTIVSSPGCPSFTREEKSRIVTVIFKNSASRKEKVNFH